MITWSPADLADLVASTLEQRARDADQEQAVKGIDASAELDLHPMIQAAFRDAGYGVWPETRYPDDWHHKAKSRGLRCDLVLTPDGLPLRDLEARGTLFSAAVEAADPQDAYWLEVKTVAQFEHFGPAKRYASELLRPVAKDVTKIWRDGVIRSGGLLIVVFTSDRRVAEHDLDAWYERCVQRGLPVGMPARRGFALNDRMGNAWCAVDLCPVRAG